MVIFPSVEWFDALRQLVNADPRFRAFGNCDVRVGVQIDENCYALEFEAFACTQVRAISAAEVEACDFVLEMSGKQWREMLENIRAHGSADRRHTLNSLDLPNILHVRATTDYSNRDKFYQYNQSLQFFFDTAAQLDTQFAA